MYINFLGLLYLGGGEGYQMLEVLGAKGPGDLPAGYSLSPPAEAFYVNNAFPPRRVMVPRRRRWLQGNSSEFPREVVQRGGEGSKLAWPTRLLPPRSCQEGRVRRKL